MVVRVDGLGDDKKLGIQVCIINTFEMQSKAILSGDPG